MAAPSEQRLIRNKSSFSVLVEVCLLPEWGQEAGRSWHPHSPLSPSELSASSGGCWARWAGWASWTPAPWAGGSSPSPPPPPDRLVNGGRHTAEVSQGALGARWTGETPRALVCKTVWPTHPQVRGAHEDRAHPAPRAPRQLPAAGSSRGTARTSGLTLALSSGASSQYFAQRPPCREHPRAASALSATFMMRS